MIQKIIYESAEKDAKRSIKLANIVGIIFIIWGILVSITGSIMGRFIIAFGIFFIFCSFLAKLISKL